MAYLNNSWCWPGHLFSLYFDTKSSINSRFNSKESQLALDILVGKKIGNDTANCNEIIPGLQSFYTIITKNVAPLQTLANAHG